jgi:hypothetical protein
VRLSLCCVTAAPAAQIAALLSPWREVADEIVIGYDDRSDDGELERLRQLADRVIAIRFRHLEAHLEELHRACTGDWVFRVDADEVPSEALVGRLPELVDDPEISQWAVARRWVAPDRRGWLDEQPWAPDWQVRLVRNDDRLRFSGELHTGPEPTGRRAYCLAPLYHLDCALAPTVERRDKAIVYDVLRPGLRAPGGTPLISYYQPERWATHPPEPVPDVDRPAVDALLTAAGVGRLVPPAQGRSERPPRPSGQTAEARIEVVERNPRFSPGEHRPLAIEVTNTSQTAWPGSDEAPEVRPTYRWAPADGVGEGEEGFRTDLPRRTEPGETTVVPLLVGAPGDAGRRRLVIDLVHEHVRWYGVDCEVEVQVAAPAPAPLRRETLPLRRRWPRRSPSPIPRILHRVWLGDRPMPDQHREWGETWRRHHPGWEHRLWTDAEVPTSGATARARNVVERSDAARYEVLRRHGGVYVDTDMECLRPLDPLLEGVRVFAAYEVPGRLCNAVLGTIPGHPAMEQLVRLVDRTSGTGHFPSSTGPPLVTQVLETIPDVTLFGPERFYPYLWDEPQGNAGSYPDAYAVHHWAMSWKQLDPGGAPSQPAK